MKDSGALAIWRLGGYWGVFHQRYQLRSARKSFPPRRQFTRRARCSCSAGPPGLDHVGGIAKSSATSETTSTSTTALARCETRPHNRGRCPGLDCRIPIQQQHPRPRILTQSPSAQPIRRTPAASTPKSGRIVHRYGILADTPTMPRPASHSRLVDIQWTSEMRIGHLILRTDILEL